VATDTISLALPIVRQLCLQFEGLRLYPYLCLAGIPTIGVGSTYYEDGTRVKLSDPKISKERALALLDSTLLSTYLPKSLSLCPRVSYSTLAVLADFSYNLGVTRLKGSTLRRAVNAGDMQRARLELAKWVRGGGRILPGLVARRQAEIRLLGDYNGSSK